MVRIAVISSIFIVHALYSVPSASAQNPKDEDPQGRLKTIGGSQSDHWKH
jgi:hypothetical protein